MSAQLRVLVEGGQVTFLLTGMDRRVVMAPPFKLARTTKVIRRLTPFAGDTVDENPELRRAFLDDAAEWVGKISLGVPHKCE